MRPTSTPYRPAPRRPGRFSRRHVMMLALALEVLLVGAVNADRYRRPGITVEVPATRGHVIV